MIADITITEKSFGNKSLYRDLRLSIQAGEKVGLVGRNGVGKSTLLGIMDGSDPDFSGEVVYRRGLVVVATRQEHHGLEHLTVLEYVLGDLPEYARLKHIIDHHPEHMGDNMARISEYSDALARFDDLGYYTIEDSIIRELGAFQINSDLARGSLAHLSGGQKRLTEVVKIMHARAHLALIDEPTNHMDYVAKEQFIEWMRAAPEAMLIVTHDRDVLSQVDRIVEIRDGAAHSYVGNYEAYLRQNATSTAGHMHSYEVTQRQIENLKSKVIQFRRLKEKARDPDTIKQFKRREGQARAELEKLQAIEKPTFWIDRESAATLHHRVESNYQKYKARNIRISGLRGDEANSRTLLVSVENLSLGYDSNAPLFEGVAFQLREGERCEFRGRNGAGKTTLIRALLSTARGQHPETVRAGTITIEPGLPIGVYEQEVSPQYFALPLAEAIERLHLDRGLPITEQRVMQLMSSYLFDPQGDARIPIAQLSGGQKARFQLISLLANEPRLIILDEPTNHLDLPSIEELESALQRYSGALIYVSHDAHFRSKVPAEVIRIGV